MKNLLAHGDPALDEKNALIRAEEYCKLYQVFERGIRKVSKNLCIGGPALAGKEVFLDKFLAYTKENDLQIDYVCYHAYGTGPTALNEGRAKWNIMNNIEKIDARNAVIISADTVVYANGKILGKPSDTDDALRMLKMLSGSTHKVVTGVAVTVGGVTKSAASVTEVKVDTVPDEELIKRLLLRGQDSGRKDDADEGVIRNRIDVYKAQTAIVADFYSAQGKYVEVDGVGSIDEIFDRLCAEIDKL
jgi:hypothetical protein